MPAPTCLIVAAPFGFVGVVPVSEVVGVPLEVPVDVVCVPEEDCELEVVPLPVVLELVLLPLELEVVLVVVVVDCTMLNWPDWARILFNSWGSTTRLTWNPSPTGQPPEGGLQTTDPEVPSTKEFITRLFTGMIAVFWFVRTAVKFNGSVLTRCQLKVF